MKNLFTAILFISFLLSQNTFANDNIKKNGCPDETCRTPLREQMDKMILSIADIDIMMNKTQELDYGILKEDAVRILEALKEIKRIDVNKTFESHIANLEKPTKKLLKYSEANDIRAGLYTQKIFNACYKCHAEHRQQQYE